MLEPNVQIMEKDIEKRGITPSNKKITKKLYDQSYDQNVDKTSATTWNVFCR